MENGVNKPKLYVNDIRVTKAINFLSGRLAWNNRNNIKLVKNRRTNQAYIKVKDKNGNETVSPIYKWSRVSLAVTISASLVVGVGLLSAKAVQAKTLPHIEISYQENEEYREKIQTYLALKDKEIVGEANIPSVNNVEEGFSADTVTTNGIVARNAVLTSTETSSCEQAKYDKIINNLKPYCDTYGKRYGIDPNLIAALMMTEAGGGEFDINNDHNYQAVGYLQLNGNIWDNETLKVYDFVDKCDKVYTIDANGIMGDSEKQVECFAIMLADYARKDNYNVCAMIEEHNKGCGTLANAIDSLKGQYPGKNEYDLLSDHDASLVESTINKSIGDGEYFNKTMGYVRMLLDNHEFNDNDYITIYDANSNQYNYSVNVVPSRSR